MNRTGIAPFVCASLMAALLLIAAQPASAQGTSRGGKGYEYQGPYIQAGAAVGEVNARGDSDDASGGFTLTGGYRILPWLAADGNFTYLGNDDDEFFSFTFGPKVYPLGAFKVEEIPSSIQPYGLIGLGGGQFDTDSSPDHVRNVEDKGSFIARFILGVDFWATDHLGFFVEGGGHAASENNVRGAGIFTVGGQYRF